MRSFLTFELDEMKTKATDLVNFLAKTNDADTGEVDHEAFILSKPTLVCNQKTCITDKLKTTLLLSKT